MDDDAPDGEPTRERAGDGLAPRRFHPLAPGDVRPEGWLAAQLETQAAGLTGTLPEFWPDLADNRWLGGANDGWERGPYYADGLVPLAALLEDDALRERAERWVEAFLDGQDGTGWIGPVEAAGDYEPFDPWPRFVVLKVLRQHADATGDERAVEAIAGFCRYLHAALRNRSLFSWGRFRWADLVVTVDWLYERTGEAWLLDLAELAAEQGYDWTDHFVDFRHPRPRPADERALETHVVNNAMGVKAPAVRARRAVDADASAASPSGTAAVDAGIEALDRFHGQVTGAFSGDEHLAGRSPVRGTELCAVVEYLYSLRYLLSVDGDPAYADRLERLAFNALPATLAPDASAHQYDQQVNQVVCDVADRGWTNDPDATLFGIAPHYGCCTANLHQGWPKVATGMAMATDDGLAALVHGPYEATAEVGVDEPAAVTVRSRTAYPFADEVTFAFELDAPVTFPFGVRVPSWAVEPAVETPDGDGPARVEPGSVHVVERTFADGDEVTCTFPAAVEAVRRQRGAVALRRGPLVFSHAPGEQWRRVRGHPPDADYEVHPTTAWRYALAVDPADPAPDVEVSRSPPGDPPFAPDEPPVTLRVPARHCPEWEATGTGDARPPTGPVRASGESTTLDLVPYGCTNLRVTEFPLVAER
jgi:hypothetical protein